jgi:3'-phosphoadenosine 5'-phosphosulfate (PAPS) 3'-phosphatase
LNAALIKAKWVNVCGKIAQRFALFVGLFRAESQVIGVAQQRSNRSLASAIEGARILNENTARSQIVSDLESLAAVELE